MASTSHPFYTLVLLLTICHHGLGSPVKIHVTNQYQTELSLNAFNIRCTLEAHETCGKTISFLTILKDSETFVGFQRDDSVFYNRLRRSSVKAEGHIDADDNNMTYFSVTVLDAMKEDSGLYSCAVHYFDEHGQLKEEASSHNVAVHNPELQDVVRSLLVKVSLLENLVNFHKDEADKMQQKMTELEIEGKTCSHMMNEIVDRDSFSSAFSVYGTNQHFNVGETIVFKRFLLNIGNHYNMATGVFTAPRKGLYVFSLLVSSIKNDRYIVHLKVNGVVMTTLYTDDKNYSHQSSVSTVVSLDTGDDVLPYVSNGGTLVSANGRYTIFNGYLLKQL